MSNKDFTVKHGINVRDGQFTVNSQGVKTDGVSVATQDDVDILQTQIDAGGDTNESLQTQIDDLAVVDNSLQTQIDAEAATRLSADNSLQSQITQGFSNEIDKLTYDEVLQLKNVNSTTITPTQWGYLGSLNQDVATGASVEFVNVGVNGVVESKFQGTPPYVYVPNPNAVGLQNSDSFARAVSTSTLYTICGAPLEDYVTSGTGTVYIFNNRTSELLHTIHNPTPNLNDNFGHSVGISETYSIVGSPSDDVPIGGSGRAYIFDNATGALVWDIENPNSTGTGANDSFGWAVATSETYSIVGAPNEDPDGQFDAGVCYIFDNATGNLLHTLEDPNYAGTPASDNFGEAVAICETYSIVGAWNEDPDGQLDAGTVYIYDNATGNLLWTIPNPSPSGGDYFGYSVAITEAFSVVGAYQGDEPGTNYGTVYVYDNATGSLLGTITNPNAGGIAGGDYFGYSVSASPKYIMVGAYRDYTTNLWSGTAYVFNSSNFELVWTFENPLVGWPGSTQDYFGYSVGVSDSHAVAGAHQYDVIANNDNAGAAFFYQIEGTTIVNNSLDVNGVLKPNSIELLSDTSISDDTSTFVLPRQALGTTDNPTFNDVSVTNLDLTGTIETIRTESPVLTVTINNPDENALENDRFGNGMRSSGRFSMTRSEDAAQAAQQLEYHIIENATGRVIHTEERAYTTYDIDDKYYVLGYTYTNTSYSGDIWIYNTLSGDLVHSITNPNPEANSNFGYAVGINSTHCLVGAYGANTPTADSGLAYIFDNVTGDLVHTLTNPNDDGIETSDYFGFRVAMSKKYSLVTARYETNPTGRVYLFDNVTGGLVHTFEGPSDSNEFGHRIDVCDSYSVVSELSYGAVYIFDNVTGEQLYRLEVPAGSTRFNDGGVQINDAFCSVGDTAFTVEGVGSAGAVFLFDNRTGDLVYTVTNPDAEGGNPVAGSQSFGHHSMGDNFLVCGHAYYHGVVADEGKISVYDISGLTTVFGNLTAKGDIIGNRVLTSAGVEYAAYDQLLNTYDSVEFVDVNVTGNISSPNLDIPAVPVDGIDYVFWDNPSPYYEVQGDLFGQSVATNGQLSIVGAEGSYDGQYTDAGRVYVYHNASGELLYSINNPNVANNPSDDWFGRDVDISENYLIVGAPSEDSPTSNSGVAYIFDNATGSLVHTLINPSVVGTTDNDQFGARVAICDKYALVGAPFDNSISGAAYIFDTVTGKLIFEIENPNDYGGSTNDYFGEGVDVTDTYSAVGAYNAEGPSGQSEGIVYIYDNVTGALVWTLLNPNNTTTSDQFGKDIAIDERYCLVGASLEDDSSDQTGAAYLYDITTGNLLHTFDNPDADGLGSNDYFGSGVAICNKYVAIGAYGEDLTGTNQGIVYVYDVETYELLWTITNPNDGNFATSDNFGLWVAVSDSWMISGAPYERRGESGVGEIQYTVGCVYKYNIGAKTSFSNNVEVPSDVKVHGVLTDRQGGLYRTCDQSLNSYNTPSFEDINLTRINVGKGSEDVYIGSEYTTYSGSWGDISRSSRDVVVEDLSAQTTTPVSVVVMDSGNRMYVTSTTDQSIYQYTLLTPYDINSASYVNSFNTGLNINGLFMVDSTVFGQQGVRFFVTTGADGKAHQYKMGTDWDITTSTLNANNSLATGIETLDSVQVLFDEGGWRQYIIVGASGYIYQYGNTFEPWRIWTSDVPTMRWKIEHDNLIGARWNYNGTKIYFTDSSNITYQYTVNNPWHVDEGLVYDEVSFTSLATVKGGIAFNDDGTKFYQITNGDVDQYTMGEAGINPVFTSYGDMIVEGDIDVNGINVTGTYSVNGNVGVSGTFTNITGITVENGIITAITGT